MVITGLGVVSPIGIGGKAYWESLQQQRSGVTLLPEMAATDLPVRIGGTIAGFEPKQFVTPRKALKVMSREIQTGFSSAVLAMEQAGMEPGRVPPERMGVIFGAEMLYCEPQDMLAVYRRCMDEGQFRFERWGAAAMSEMYPLWMLMYLPNMIACHIGIAHDARGPNNTICQGDVSSLLALIEAAHIIRRGHADVMIVGGSSSRLSITPMLYRGIHRLSRRNDSPSVRLPAVRRHAGRHGQRRRGGGVCAWKGKTMPESRRRTSWCERRRLGHLVRRPGQPRNTIRAGPSAVPSRSPCGRPI